MGLDDKIRNTAQDAAGTAKEKVGEVTGDEQLEAEGVVDQAEAKLRKAAESVKDGVRDVADHLKK
jgi:uncharacterized protein YjbJ (UPF0337 family)